MSTPVHVEFAPRRGDVAQCSTTLSAHRAPLHAVDRASFLDGISARAPPQDTADWRPPVV